VNFSQKPCRRPELIKRPFHLNRQRFILSLAEFKYYQIMPKKTAGILLFRLNPDLEVFLVHPGGPFFANKDKGFWSIPKGEFESEEPLEAAKREFMEETGTMLSGPFVELSPIKQKSGKMVYAWAMEGDFDESQLKCNTFSIEWPPRSGKRREFPEVDKGGWFTLREAKEKMMEAQSPFLLQLQDLINERPKEDNHPGHLNGTNT
jgi:predicted NUDIX family NTP pyrophosphohydrolase